MKALTYHGPGRRTWGEVPDAAVRDPEDAVVRADAVTICGTDLHILKGDVPGVADGRVLGHEAVGTVTETGPGTRTVQAGDRRFGLDEMQEAYDVFADAGGNDALKVALFRT